MRILKSNILVLSVILLTGITAIAQTKTAEDKMAKTKTTTMKTYLIERDIPDAGKFTAEQLKGISQKSCSVLKDMGPQIEWVQSYVTADKIFCIYKAENAELIKEHAAKGGFPANSITEVTSGISPATAK